MDIEELERMMLAAWNDWSCDADNMNKSAARLLDALNCKFDDLTCGNVTHEVLTPLDDCCYSRRDKRKSITIDVAFGDGKSYIIVASKDGVKLKQAAMFLDK